MMAVMPDVRLYLWADPTLRVDVHWRSGQLGLAEL
jgi:hypothetical protein